MTAPTRNDTAPVLRALAAAYAPVRLRVAAAEQRMREVVGRPHRPAEAREAARDLTLALRDATTAVVNALRVIDAAAARTARTARTARSADLVSSSWSAELVRLSEMGVWLRRETRDDVGVAPAATVRIGSRAASGPHIAGIEAEPRDLVAATLHEPRIGVDLMGLIDGPAGETRKPRSVAPRGAGTTWAA